MAISPESNGDGRLIGVVGGGGHCVDNQYLL